MELEAECAQGGSGASGKDGSRKAKDVALLYEALQEALWAVLAEALAAKSAYPPLEQLVQVIEQEEEADRSWRQAQGGSAGSPGPRQMRQRWAEAVDRLAGQKLCQCVEGRAGTIATRMDRLAKCTVEDLSSVKRHLLQAYPEEYQAFGVYLGSYHRGLARCLAEGVRKQLSLSELYFVLDWNSNIYQRWAVRAPWSGGGRLGESLGSLQDCPPSTDPPGAQVGMPAGSWHTVCGGVGGGREERPRRGDSQGKAPGVAVQNFLTSSMVIQPSWKFLAPQNALGLFRHSGRSTLNLPQREMGAWILPQTSFQWQNSAPPPAEPSGDALAASVPELAR